MDGVISVKFHDGTSALWVFDDDKPLDEITDFIEKNYKKADSVGG